MERGITRIMTDPTAAVETPEVSSIGAAIYNQVPNISEPLRKVQTYFASKLGFLAGTVVLVAALAILVVTLTFDQTIFSRVIFILTTAWMCGMAFSVFHTKRYSYPAHLVNKLLGAVFMFFGYILGYLLESTNPSAPVAANLAMAGGVVLIFSDVATYLEYAPKY
jgi:sugar (pentulose or hexulose) kinase